MNLDLKRIERIPQASPFLLMSCDITDDGVFTNKALNLYCSWISADGKLKSVLIPFDRNLLNPMTPRAMFNEFLNLIRNGIEQADKERE